MSDYNLILNANTNLKQQPNGLCVYGTVMVYTAETEVSTEENDVQGINENILLLKLTITPQSGPKKGVLRNFGFVKCGSDVSKYTQVQVVTNQGESCTVNVTEFR